DSALFGYARKNAVNMGSARLPGRRRSRESAHACAAEHRRSKSRSPPATRRLLTPLALLKDSESARRGRGSATIEPKSARQWPREICCCFTLPVVRRKLAMLAGTVFESIGFFSPGLTDGFETRVSIQSLETLGEVVGVEEYLHVLAKLVVAVVVVAPNSRLFESTVHPLDLPVRPSGG